MPGLIGTVATMIGAEEIKTGFTTPEAPELQALLAVMRERGVTDVAMEVSSHALAMGRVDGIALRRRRLHQPVRGPPRLPRRHGRLLRREGAAVRPALARRPVVVVDDEWGSALVDLLGRLRHGQRGALTPRDERARGLAGRLDGQRRADGIDRVPSPGRAGGRSPTARLGCAIPGRYNVANALLAARPAARGRRRPSTVAAPADRRPRRVPGRMERIDAGQPFLAVVDYSHKPAAVDGALRALRPLTRGRLIIVLGCGGDRDRGKRPHMGEIAARGADLLVVTDDNPRSEDPAAIRRAMLDGALAVPPGERGEVVEVGDRADGDRRRGGRRRPRRHRPGRRQGARDRAGDRRRRAPLRRPAAVARRDRIGGDVR